MTRRRYWMGAGLVLGAGISAGVMLWQREQRKLRSVSVPAQRARSLLERAAPLIRLPTSPNCEPQVLNNGSGLRCPETGTIYPYRRGVLDLIVGGTDKTFTQDALDTPVTAWGYDAARGAITALLRVQPFAEEVADLQEIQQYRAGDVAFDLACGQGNFTVEIAKRVGDGGLVIGLDLSPAMLARAAYHVERWGLKNVFLIRGDALNLPFRDGVFKKVNCSGGFHQFPDLAQAIKELGRVSSSGAILTAGTFAEGTSDRLAAIKRRLKERFALHFVPLIPLGSELEAVGFNDYDWSMPGPWFGYASARKDSVHR